MATAEQIRIANATSRARGAVGARAVVPRKAREYFTKGAPVLDYGAGREALHAQALREEGYTVDAHDFGDNRIEGVHIVPGAATLGAYTQVYASNVLNVQSDAEMMRETLRDVCDFMAPGGVFIANYPQSPRKWEGATARTVRMLLELAFEQVSVTGNSSAPVFICKGPK